jgi:hypothetical protein
MPLAAAGPRRDALATVAETTKGTAASFRMPVWGWVLVVGLVLAATLHFVHVPGALGAVLELVGGLLLIGGSCEALIISVEGGSALLGWSKFVGGTFAAVVSNIPEIALLGFFVVDDPTMAGGYRRAEAFQVDVTEGLKKVLNGAHVTSPPSRH